VGARGGGGGGGELRRRFSRNQEMLNGFQIKLFYFFYK